VELISLWTNPDAVIFTRDVPIRALDDLAGLKIRVPSRNAGMIVEAWGATPVSMPAPQMYNALQTGVIDGALIDEGGVLSFKLEEVASFMTRGMQSQISPFMIVMNRDAFADLSNAQQTALKDIGQKMSLVAQETRAASSVRGADVFAAAEGHEIIELSEAEAARFDDAAVSALEAVVAELEADGIPAAEFVSALQGE
jgi:TRAP-type C4-dicarboxylate transport system substrate-binding protein